MAYSFTPTTDKIALGDPASGVLDFTTDYTFSCWCYANSWEPAVGGGGYRTFIAKGGNYVFRQEYGFWTNSTSAVTFIWWDNTNIIGNYTSGNPSTSQWVHIAGVVSSNAVSAIYFDGVSQSLSTKSVGGARDLTQSAYIGQNGDDTACFDGSIAEVATWNVALTQDEITALAKRYSPRLIRPASLTTYFPLLRNAEDIKSGVSGTVTGATVATHSPTLYPRKTRYVPKATAAASIFSLDHIYRHVAGIGA